jgi:hypothetical protein
MMSTDTSLVVLAMVTRTVSVEIPIVRRRVVRRCALECVLALQALESDRFRRKAEEGPHTGRRARGRRLRSRKARRAHLTRGAVTHVRLRRPNADQRGNNAASWFR